MDNKIKLPFKLGADPEMQLTVGNIKTQAHAILDKEIRNSYGNVGFDHNEILEIRPRAGTPEELSYNIGKLFQAIAKKLPYCSLSTLSFDSCVGGHIHFELVEDLAICKDHDITEGQRQRLNSLHRILSVFNLPIMLSENKASLKLRLNSGYGDIINDAYRLAPKKGAWTFEFRTPSAEWITSAEVCRATLAYFAIIYYEFLNRPDSFKQLDKWIWKTELQAHALRDLVLSEHKMLTEIFLKELNKAIKTFQLYPQYKKEADFILDPEKGFKAKLQAKHNPIAGWGLTPKLESYSQKKARKTDFVMDKSQDNKLVSPSEALLVKSIIYNKDFKVEDFAYALADNVYKAKAQLKNSYFLFGFKKGSQNHPIITLGEKEGRMYGNKQTILLGEDIKDIEGLKETEILFSKMLEKYKSKTRRTDSKIYLIGLPYEMREKLDYLKLFKLVAGLESPKFKPADFSQLPKRKETKPEAETVLENQEAICAA